MDGDLTRIRGVADYQFGRGCGRALFPDGVTIILSKNTGRIRHVYLGGVMLASFRPTDGFFTLTIAGAERMMSSAPSFGFTVTVDGDVACFVANSRSAFAKHVVEAGEGIRPGDEVIVVDEGGRVLAVGQALLNGREMLAFRVGVAVKVRRGRNRDA
jgi:uncharacterized protein with predicted RNA binding PUA domain